MKTVTTSRIAGTFLGYAPHVVFDLDDGSSWEQTGNRVEYVYRENPTCRVLWDQGTGRYQIDVEGTSHTVEVTRYTGKRWAGPGAF